MGRAIISESGGDIIPESGGDIIPELGGGFLRNQHLLGSRVRIPSHAPNCFKGISLLIHGRREATFVLFPMVSAWFPPQGTA